MSGFRFQSEQHPAKNKTMVGFYDDLKNSRPENIHDLWPTTSSWWETKGRSGNFGSCTLAEHLDVWATEDEINRFLDEAGQNDMYSLVKTFHDTSITLIELLNIMSRAHEWGKIILLSDCCAGCNRDFDRTYQEDGDLDYYQELGDNNSSIVHISITTLGVINHLLMRKREIEDFVHILIYYHDPLSAGGRETSMIEKLLRLGEGFISVIPKLGIAAFTCLSLCAARSPSLCFQSISKPIKLAEGCEKYMTSVLEHITDYVFVCQLSWGTVSFTRIIPLLYQIGSWKLAIDSMTEKTKSSLVQKIAMFAVKLFEKRDQGEQMHSPDFRTLMESAFLKKKCNHSVSGPDFAIVGALDILQKWDKMGVNTGQFDQEQRESLHPLIDDYSPHLDYLRSFLGIESDENSKNDGSNSRGSKGISFLHSMTKKYGKCGLPTCQATNASAENNTKTLFTCGGCNGLELYCCREHQRQHWAVHKRFCKRKA